VLGFPGQVMGAFEGRALADGWAEGITDECIGTTGAEEAGADTGAEATEARAEEVGGRTRVRDSGV